MYATVSLIGIVIWRGKKVCSFCLNEQFIYSLVNKHGCVCSRMEMILYMLYCVVLKGALSLRSSIWCRLHYLFLAGFSSCLVQSYWNTGKKNAHQEEIKYLNKRIWTYPMFLKTQSWVLGIPCHCWTAVLHRALLISPGPVKEESGTNLLIFSRTCIFWKTRMPVLCFITVKIIESVTLCYYLMVKSHLLPLVNSLVSLLGREMLLVSVVTPQMQSTLLFKLTTSVSLS